MSLIPLYASIVRITGVIEAELSLDAINDEAADLLDDEIARYRDLQRAILAMIGPAKGLSHHVLAA